MMSFSEAVFSSAFFRGSGRSSDFSSNRALRKIIPLRELFLVNFILSLAVVLLSGSATLRIPIKIVAFPVAAILLLLAVGLKLWFSRKRPSRKRVLFYLLAITVVSLAVWPAITRKTFISYVNDAWAYCAFGQYLNDYPRGMQRDDLPIIDQYGATLSSSRFGTPTLLAFLSGISGKTTPEVLSAWTWLTLLISFCGVASFCCILSLSTVASLGASVFFILCGWLHVAIFVANWDNILFLAILPFTLTRYYLFVRGTKSFAATAGLAISGAACFYCYPEGTAIAGTIFLPWLAAQLLRDLRMKRRLKAYAALGLGFSLLVTPYIPVFISFLQGQFLQTRQHPYPGEGYFPGLMRTHTLTGLFAIGGESMGGAFPTTGLQVCGVMIAVLLFFFLSVGALAWNKTNRTLIFSVLVVTGFAFWQGVVRQYDYGLYKILFIGSVLWIPCIFHGLEKCAGFFAYSSRHILIFALAVFTCLACIGFRRANASEYPDPGLRIDAFSKLKNVPKIVDKRPIALICGDDFDQQWATFFLRNSNVFLQRFTTYLTAVPPAVQNRVPQIPLEFVVTDYRPKDALWGNSRFRLVRTDLRPEIIAIDAPNSVEGERRNFVWLGNDPTSFYCTSDKEQVGCFSATAIPGPSRPEDTLRTVTIRSENETRRLSVSASFSCLIHLHKGLNRIEIWCNEQRSVLRLGNGESRNLLLGLKDFAVSPCG